MNCFYSSPRLPRSVLFFVVDCLSVCRKLQIDSFLFLDGIEPFFGRQFSMTPSTRRRSLIFDLGPVMPKIDFPKFAKKSPISRLVWQINRRCLHLPGVFGDGRFNGTIQNVVGPTLVVMATKFGLGAEI